MTALRKPMTVDDYIDWSLKQPSGRFELFHGEIVPMNAQRVSHIDVKRRIANALEDAITSKNLTYFVLGDGATVQVDDHNAYEPDALVYGGDALPPDAIVVPEPLVVVEVSSPSTAGIDAGVKFVGYFTVPSVRHYLIVDVKARKIIHHRRDADGSIRSEIVSGGSLTLDPPGLSVSLTSIFK
jgi:Uma2 family endonuclease